MLTCSIGIAQNNIDSLYGVWQDESQSASTRIEAYNAYISEGFLYSNPDSAALLTEKLITFSNKTGNLNGSALGYRLKGIISYRGGDLQKALEYQEIGLEFAEKYGDKKGIARALNSVGVIYYRQGEYNKAINIYSRAVVIQKEIPDKGGLARTAINMGHIYREKGDYIKALNNYSQSLKSFEELDHLRGISFSLNFIGAIYMEQGDYAKALDYNLQSVSFFEELGDQVRVASTLQTIGVIHQRQSNYEQALEYFSRVLTIYEAVGNPGGIANTLDDIGVTYGTLGEHQKAMTYLKRTLKTYEEIDNKVEIANTTTNIGDNYLEQGDNAAAIKYCKKALALAEELGMIQIQKDGCLCLYNAYKNLGNGSAALTYHEKMLALTDSLNLEETAKKLQLMEFQKEVLADSLKVEEEKLKVEMTHQIEVRKKEKNRNIAFGSGLFFLLLAGGLFGRNRYIRKSKAIIEKEKDRSENLLLNILPAEIAEELKEKGEAAARDFDRVSILFTDFKEFTQLSEQLSAQELVSEINHCFKAFDAICANRGIEKIKTIGDSYMAAGGLPVPDEHSAKNLVLAALDMVDFVIQRKEERVASGQLAFTMRAGIHTGPVVAGIVGVKKFQYDIWGDTVNTASRMESHGKIGTVNISHSTYEIIKDDAEFKFKHRGKLQVKGKGEVEMYFVERN